jgi:hypothetical protein
MELHADKVNLATLLAVNEQQFIVPPYQRPYAWGADEIDDLWDDIQQTLGSGHFMGSLVLNAEDEQRQQIIDGQQRLTTSCLILAAVRDEYARLGSQLVSRPQDLLTADPFASGDARFKLRVGDGNWQVFRDFVLRDPSDEERKQWPEIQSLSPEVQARNRALSDNARRISEHLGSYLNDAEGSMRLDKLELLERTVAKQLTFVAVRVGTVADAFLLFETLNDRGLQLSAADLLKSHLLGKIAAQGDDQAVEEASDRWDDLINDLGGDVDVTRFLRHFLLIRQSTIRKDQVFDAFKSEVARVGPSAVLQSLQDVAVFYGDFEHPGRVQDPDVAAVLADLKTLRAVACYPALMPARRWLSTTDFVSFARLVEVLTYRYSSVVGLGTNDLERQHYHKAAKLLEDSKGIGLEDARQALIAAMPSSELFQQSFRGLTMGVHYLVKYTMRRIEAHLSKSLEKEVKQDAQVHIEHIMPQTLSTEWRQALGERAADYQAYVNRWGNLTLLYYALNIVASNDAFRVKKREYKKSEVELTRRLCDLATWDFDAIETRQRWLGEVADQVWSVAALEEGLDALPALPVAEVDLTELLPADDRASLEKLSFETSSEEALGLSGRVDAYVAVLEDTAHTQDFVDLALAKRVAESINGLVDDSPGYNAQHRALLRGAVEYFLLTEDSQNDIVNPIGLDDDARVISAVCTALGRPDLVVTPGDSSRPDDAA